MTYIANKESPPIRQLYANKTVNKVSTPVMAFERKQRTQQIRFLVCVFFRPFSKNIEIGEK